MPDKTLTCRECGNTFVFSAEEQELFAQRGYTNQPSRCPSCREARRSEGRGGGGGYGGGGYGGGGGGYGRREREMFPAVCAQCGKETQVPFQPRGDRPVYCQDCYDKQRPGGGQPRRTRSW